MKLTLRKKLLFFSVILALIPLCIAGRFMIRITQDEVKSFLNDELLVTAGQIAQEIDGIYTHSWLAPLLMMKRVVENDDLGSSEKMSILTGIGDVSDIVSLQISVEGASRPTLITQDRFTSRLSEAKVDSAAVLTLAPEQIRAIQEQDPNSDIHSRPLIWEHNGIFNKEPEYIPEIDCWLFSIIIPLKDIAGRKAALSAKISLERIRKKIEDHPFSKTGNIMLINSRGEAIFDRNHEDLSDYEIVRITKDLLNAKVGTTGVAPYTRGREEMLAGYTFPSNFGWVVIVEKDVRKAYLAVSKMVSSLFMLALIGLVIAVAGAVMFANRISRPILEIGRVAQQVGEGELDVRVNIRKSQDEISKLGEQINQMIDGLNERFQLQKFVSDQTMEAIKQADIGGICLGGERKTATVLFSDIRGFTAFSEKHEPETVIKMLNTYLREQAQIVHKYNGDIDKYVGDELVAVFQEKDMIRNAVLCAAEIHREIDRLNKKQPWDIRVGIGINTGEMIMGAMGSEDRMDYTILGDNVNLAARLCSHAGPEETILSEKSYNKIHDRDNLHIRKGDKEIRVVIKKGEKIEVKGKSKRVRIYRVFLGKKIKAQVFSDP
ncbi:adenylate/guanylate cyclase domain-containing protein [Desulfobacterales bacterium HSG2]|nr:adenylate/guanylate cyclase domain-containing protein [Desulfobacterales bacterium HSG2]